MLESTYKIKRTIYKEIIDTINNKAVTVIKGARQVGKTTICSKLEEELGFNYVSLADPIIRNAAKSDPCSIILEILSKMKLI